MHEPHFRRNLFDVLVANLVHNNALMLTGNIPVFTQRLEAYSTLCSTLYTRHKNYTWNGTDKCVLWELLPADDKVATPHVYSGPTHRHKIIDLGYINATPKTLTLSGRIRWIRLSSLNDSLCFWRIRAVNWPNMQKAQYNLRCCLRHSMYLSTSGLPRRSWRGFL